METNTLSNLAQKCSKLSMISSDSGNFSIGDNLESRPVLVVLSEDLESLAFVVRNALEIKGKKIECLGGLFENLKQLVNVLCQEFLKYQQKADETLAVGFRGYNKDVWEKIFHCDEHGCFLNSAECRDVRLVVTNFIRGSKIQDLESKIKYLQETLVRYKVEILRFSNHHKNCFEKVYEYQEFKDTILKPPENLTWESIHLISSKLNQNPKNNPKLTKGLHK